MRFINLLNSIWILTALASASAQTDFSWDGESETPNAQYGPAAAIWDTTSITWIPGNTPTGTQHMSWVNSLDNTAQFKTGTVVGTNPSVDTLTLTLGEDIIAKTIDVGGSFAPKLVISGGDNNHTLTVSQIAPNGASLTLDVVIAGSNGLTKVNGGEAILKRANTYTGTTNVNQGNIIADNELAFSSSVVRINNTSKVRLNYGVNNVIYLNSTLSSGALELNGAMALGGTINLQMDSTIRQLVSGASQTFNGALQLGASNLTFVTGNTTLNGVISGTGNLIFTGGTNKIAGSSGNTFTGTTTFTGSLIELDKSSGNAISGDLIVNGGTLSWLRTNQIADTASVTLNGGALVTTNRADTIKNLSYLSPSTTNSNFSGLNITDTFTFSNSAIHDLVNSSGSFSAKTSILSGGGTLKLGANGGPSTYNIGTGGASMNGITIQIGSTGAEAAGMVKFSGNLVANGTNHFTAINRTGVRSLDLNGSARTFEIQSGITRVQSLVSVDNGSIHKTGGGVLYLESGHSTYAGGSLVQGGTLMIGNGIGANVGSATGSGSVQVHGNSTFTGNGTITGSLLLSGMLQMGVDHAKSNFGFGKITVQNEVVFGAGANLYFNFGEASLKNPALILNPELLLIDPAASAQQDHFTANSLLLHSDLHIYLDFSEMIVQQGDVFDLFDFASINLNGFNAQSNLHFQGAYLGFDISQFEKFGVVIAIPEPSRFLLLAPSILLLLLRRSRRQ